MSKFYFDEELAERPIKFIEKYCRHMKGKYARQLIVLEEWQKKWIRDVFGWRDSKTGFRKYQIVYVEIPRKNAKSTIAACLALYLTIVEKEHGKEVYSCAGDREQAKLVFNIAKYMLSDDPKLRKLGKTFRDSIVVDKTHSFYKAISSDSKTKHGFNASAIIFDELHVQPNRDLWDTMITSTGAREQPLTIALTTAGVHDTNSIAWEIHDYALKVRDGSIDDESFLPVVFAADPDDDFTKEETWKKANPGFGTIVSADYLRKEAKKAETITSYEATFRRLHLNQWTNTTTRWISDKAWMDCDISPINENDFIGRACYAGLDLASHRDITALTFIFPDEDGERFDVIPYFFAPREKAYTAERRDKVPYLQWEKEGKLILTDGDVTDYNFIQSEILRLMDVFDIKAIAYDRWNSSQLVINMVDEGVPMIPWGQGFASMSAPTKSLEKMILSKQFNHGGNDVLRWMASNVAMKQDPAGNLKPDKSKSNGRIDGIVAIVMSIGIYLSNDVEDSGSNYDDRGIIWL